MNNDQLSNYLLTGMSVGGLIAVAPVAFGVTATTATTIFNTITGLFISIITNGQWGSELTAFWISPSFWKFAKFNFMVGATLALTCGILYAVHTVAKNHFGLDITKKFT